MKRSLAIVLACCAAFAAAAQDPPLPTAHTKRDIEGWTVHIDDRLLADADQELGRHALRVLANRLYDIKHVLPADKVARLQKVPIWLDKSHGKLRPAQYHPGVGWLKKNGYAPELVKCVHIPVAAEFASVSHQRIQPWSVLHELAHAYHDQVLGFDHAEIKAAWVRFCDSGKYEQTLHINGRKTKHYALTNQMEFFAEMTEAFFGHNDFFPFNRAELQRDEPELFALLTKVWGTGPKTAPLPPVKVFILAGQSNMEGQAVVDLDGKNYNDGKGTLKALLQDPAKAPLFKHLHDGKGGWTVRDDVWVRYQRERQPLLAGPLAIGFTVYGDKHHFGPELQFGHVVGDHVKTQVLLIKTAWGGKSLHKDFRPPSADGEVGPYYKQMLAEVRTALENLPKDFPKYQGQGYELSGFVWYQGWNDGVDPKNAVPEYEQNLVSLIKDVRKDLKVPSLPVVVGELTGPWVDAPGAWATLRQAQAKAANRPEFKGNVLFVETRDFVRPAKESPNPGHGHHEFGNAETYFLVGDALGKGMLKLLAQPRQ